MYGPAAKAQILKLDSRLAMSDGMMSAMLDPRAGGPFLKLAVRRGPELVRDALTRIRAAMSNDALRKPLKARSRAPLCCSLQASAREGQGPLRSLWWRRRAS